MDNQQFAGKAILLVEDDFLIAMASQSMLEDMGAKVLGPATRIEEALAIAEKEVIDAAILDVDIRGKRSDGVAAVLKERGIPYAYSSGYNHVDLQLGGEEIILDKPYGTETLHAVLLKLLNL